MDKSVLLHLFHFVVFNLRRWRLFTICFVSHSMLPKVVKRRVHALKRLQVQCANIEAKFYEEVHELERKYAALYHPLFDKVMFIAFFRLICFYLVSVRPKAPLALVCPVLLRMLSTVD